MSEQTDQIYAALALGKIDAETADNRLIYEEEIERLRTALTTIAALEINPTRPGTVHEAKARIRTIVRAALGDGVKA